METIKLSVEPRQEKGKGKAGRLRRSGKVPGIFYGPGKDAVSVCVNTHEFQQQVADLEGSHLIQFLSDTAELNEKIVLLKEVQQDPITADPLHIDFYAIDVNVPIQVGVALHMTGRAEGVTAGGSLQSARREIMVECLPLDIPDFIEIDVSHLGINDAIHVEDLTLPSNVKSMDDAQLLLVSVAAPVAEPTPEEEAVEGETAAAEGETPAEGEATEGEARSAE